VSKPLQVTPAMYQACLRYTLLARIAPLWNKAGDWLVQGRDFLMQTGFTNAVKLEVNVNKTELYFSMEATAARFSPLK
ncbi:hypothetical protein ACJMK2_009705, partial [Sinanodonta woodiana]